MSRVSEGSHAIIHLRARIFWLVTALGFLHDINVTQQEMVNSLP